MDYQEFLDGLYNNSIDDTDEYQPGDVLFFDPCNPLLKSDEVGKKYTIRLITDDYIHDMINRENSREINKDA